MTPLTVVCWRWPPPTGYRSTFGPETVEVLRNMVRRHYQKPHRFVCITDTPGDIAADIEAIPLWSDLASVPSPHGKGNPSCYRRLKAFSVEMETVLGPRFISIDLDTVIVGDLAPVFEFPEDFRIWGETDPRSFYNGSLWGMKTGARKQVWEKFDAKTSPRAAFDAGKFGSDQGWISHCLGKGEKVWTTKDGVYSYRKHIATDGNKLPANAVLINWHGRIDPWSYKAQQIDWVREHYR
jgi:hypothetical protein